MKFRVEVHPTPSPSPTYASPCWLLFLLPVLIPFPDKEAEKGNENEYKSPLSSPLLGSLGRELLASPRTSRGCSSNRELSLQLSMRQRCGWVGFRSLLSTQPHPNRVFSHSLPYPGAAREAGKIPVLGVPMNYRLHAASRYIPVYHMDKSTSTIGHTKI